MPFCALPFVPWQFAHVAARLRARWGSASCACAVPTHAARNEAAFSAKSLDAVVAALGATTPAESGGILISAPDIAEDGAAVPVGVLSTLPGTDQIVIMVEKNLNMVAASFVIASDTMADVQTSIKMGQTSNVLAMVRADGKYFVAKREVRVTLGGCGG